MATRKELEERTENELNNLIPDNKEEFLRKQQAYNKITENIFIKDIKVVDNKFQIESYWEGMKTKRDAMIYVLDHISSFFFCLIYDHPGLSGRINLETDSKKYTYIKDEELEELLERTWRCLEDFYGTKNIDDSDSNQGCMSAMHRMVWECCNKGYEGAPNMYWGDVSNEKSRKLNNRRVYFPDFGDTIEQKETK